jgi:GDPmannose 4,6-dehydratase
MTEQLCALAYTVTGLDRAVSGPRPPATGPIDIRNRASVWQLIRNLQPDEIYYLAAFHQSAEDILPDDAQAIPENFAINTLALHHFLSGIASHSPATKLFYAASSRIFGDPAQDIQNEDTLFNPNDPYGISKAAGVQVCRYYRKKRDIFASVGILYNHESPRRAEHFITQKVVKAAVRISQGRQEKLIIGNLDAIVDWGYAPEYVDAMWRILQLNGPDDFIIASGTLHSVLELVQIAFGVVGLNWESHIEQDPQFTGSTHSHTLCGDTTRLRCRTGWTPTTSFPEMIRTIVQMEMHHAD